MRIAADRQGSLSFYQSSPSYKQEWEMISTILDAKAEVVELVLADLSMGKDGKPKKRTGANGITAEQVLRLAIVKHKEDLAYRELRDRVDDSIVLRAFCRMQHGPVPAFTTLQENIKRIRPETWKAVSQAIVGYALEREIENGQCVRVDTTAVQSNIHHPTDSHQLWDCVRVLTRILRFIEEDLPRLRGRFHDHQRAAKRLFYRIHNTRGQDNKKPLYRKLINITERVTAYAQTACEELVLERCDTFEESLVAADYRAQINQFLPLAHKVVDQTRRRVLKGEDVPADEKILSIFEPHTDIIKKGQREIIYGHKVLLTTGKSNLILDCVIERGNPSDAGQFIPSIERHQQVFGHVPAQVATDAGFASKANARAALDQGVKDVAFVGPKHKTLPELIKGTRAYKKLAKWRAGIEGIISATKRAFGLDCCTWSSFESFQAYVQLAVLAFNLQTLARHLLR